MMQQMSEKMSQDMHALARFSIGLTGGIGCGKSTVTDLFAAHGASIIDTDLLAHKVTAPDGAAMPAIRAAFGASFILPNGAMDRARMRERVFADPAEKRRLEAIVHPLIGIEVERAVVEARGSYLMFVVPLLVESGKWRERVTRVLVIDCPEVLQITRVVQRNGLHPTQVEAIMAAQVTRATRLAAADDIIVNDADMAALAPQVEHLHQQYCLQAAAAVTDERKPSQNL